jgi:hypothetical protein
MTDSTPEQLLGHVLGALDDAEQELVDSRLQHDPQLCQQVARLRRQLEPLEAGRREFTPPAGLADRTCALVFSRCKPTAGRARRRRMSAASATPGWIGWLGWRDVAVAVGVLLAASLLIFPAIQSSRFRAQLSACQDNLRELGVAMTGYSETHNKYFPQIPTKGNLAAAGIYAPVLLRDRYLTEARRVVCPGSPLAERSDFHLPSFDELRTATSKEIKRLRVLMGGSYGYSLGHVRAGEYQHTKNLRRPHFALMADAPSPGLPGYQTIDHGGRGQNVLFEDGRVSFFTCTRCGASGDDFFTNDDGLIAVGNHPDDAVIVSSATPPIIYVGNRR